jgi:hypothetical protein
MAKKGGAQGTTVSLPIIPAKETEVAVPTIPVTIMPVTTTAATAAAATTTARAMPPSKQPQTPVTSVPFGRIYPTLPTADEEDQFNYFDTPSKPPAAPIFSTKPAKRIEEETYDWEESDEEVSGYLGPYGGKRPRFELPRDPSLMQEIELSPPQSPLPVAPLQRKSVSTALADPFTTPIRQIHSTPHTPPDTRALKSPTTTLQPLSLSLLHQLDPYKESLGRNLYDRLSDHLMRCGRVADGAVKGRDAARAVNRKKDIRIEELERRVRILESEREVDRAVIGALKRNVDVLTGKVKRRDD